MCKHGTDVVVPLPKFLAQYCPNNPDDVCIDECILSNIQCLWEEKIHTLGSCCGHSKENPAIVIADGYVLEDVKRIRFMLASVDDREWDIFQWKLVKLPTCKPGEAPVYGIQGAVPWKGNRVDLLF